MNAITNINTAKTFINYLLIDENGKSITDYEIESEGELIDTLAEISETFAIAHIAEIEVGGAARYGIANLTDHIVKMAVDDWMEYASDMGEVWRFDTMRVYRGVFREALQEIADNGGFYDAPTNSYRRG